MRLYNLTQLRNDYKYIVDNYGEPYDLTGGYQTDDALFDILEGRSTRESVYRELIEYAFYKGYDSGNYAKRLPFEEDKRLLKIKERYSLD